MYKNSKIQHLRLHTVKTIECTQWDRSRKRGMVARYSPFKSLIRKFKRIYLHKHCAARRTPFLLSCLHFTIYLTVMWQFFEFFSAGFFRVYFSYLKILWNFLYDKTLLSVVYLLFMILDHGWNRVKWLEEGVHFHATSRESN